MHVKATIAGDLDLHGFLRMSENVINRYEKIQVHSTSNQIYQRKVYDILLILQKSDLLYSISFSHLIPVEVSMKKKKKQAISRLSMDLRWI
jgi:hypothetical protein